MEAWRAMTARDLDRTVRRLADEITERLGDADDFVLIGIVTGGAHLAQRLADAVARTEGHRPQVGTLDITLYRDDLYTGLEKPTLGVSSIPFELAGRHVVLVDDVLFTGRTVRAALDELMDFGRPARVQLAVLVDRGHRELPIAADFVGRTLGTGKLDRVMVSLREDGSDHDGVQIMRFEAPDSPDAGAH
ncbi:MAG: bifunctional pyr operon transcriptional regulator/uracil phosphoribosyltransferase PyrR [Oligoflexia bacterium]|nr:bifunctional pyr operon transcriptional regulator/uracil phosphoribosyltransferase PyrR [Oligoflexia bacterium]